MTNIQQSLEMERNLTLLGLEEYDCRLEARAGWRYCPFLLDDAFIFVITLATKQQLEVKSKLGSVANIIGLNCNFSSLFRDGILLARNFYLLAIDGCVDRHTYGAPHFPMHIRCTDVFLLVVRVYSHTLTPCTCMAQVTKHIVCVSPTNMHTSSSSRNVVHLAEPDTTHGHSFLTFS